MQVGWLIPGTRQFLPTQFWYDNAVCAGDHIQVCVLVQQAFSQVSPVCPPPQKFDEVFQSIALK